jgi:hypothetical protein
MTARTTPVWRRALPLFSARLVLGQIELFGLVFLLFAAWLRVPDASALDVVATVLLGLLIVAVAGCVESFVFLRLCGRERNMRPLLLGTLWLIAAVALWFGWSALITSIRGNDFQRAAYWNSRLPHQLRYFFTFERIAQWLGWMWNTITSIVAGLLVLAAASATCSTKPLRAITAALRSFTYWLVLFVDAFAATTLTSSLINWTPSHGLREEMLSLILRLGAAILFDAIALSLLLAVIAACCRSVADNAAAQSTPAGTPDLSQPRTAGNP